MFCLLAEACWVPSGVPPLRCDDGLLLLPQRSSDACRGRGGAAGLLSGRSHRRIAAAFRSPSVSPLQAGRADGLYLTPAVDEDAVAVAVAGVSLESCCCKPTSTRSPCAASAACCEIRARLSSASSVGL